MRLEPLKSLPSIRVEVSRGHDDTFAHESHHEVHAVICDGDGRIVSSYGDPEFSVFPRSSIKLLQALPLVESGAADHYGFKDEYLALACASHNGENRHVNGSSYMLEKAGLNSKCLECGAQMPALPNDVAMAIGQGGPTALHNNCSGKHSGFLAFASHVGMPSENYTRFNHELQRTIAGTLEDVLQTPHGEDNYGIDGCSIPTYQIPLYKLACAYGKVATGSGLGTERDKAVIRLRNACMTEPFMVAGTDRFDTKIMQTMNDTELNVFTKTGAEGVFTAALPRLGLGFALKCVDGTTRAAEAACAQLIVSLLMEGEDNTLSQARHDALQQLANPKLYNFNKIEVGALRAILPNCP